MNIPTIATLFGAMFGNTADQGAIGRGFQQVMMMLLGAGLVIIGVVFVVSGSKTGTVIVDSAKALATVGE